MQELIFEYILTDSHNATSSSRLKNVTTMGFLRDWLAGKDGVHGGLHAIPSFNDFLSQAGEDLVPVMEEDLHRQGKETCHFVIHMETSIWG